MFMFEASLDNNVRLYNVKTLFVWDVLKNVKILINIKIIKTNSFNKYVVYF